MSLQTIIKDLEKKINETSLIQEVERIGTVISVSDGIAKVSGLTDVMSMEELVFARGASGIALNLETDMVGVVLIDKVPLPTV